MKMHDIVRVKEDIPEENLEKGMIGVIVAILRDPCFAYEVEFCDENGRTLTETALLPEHVVSARQMMNEDHIGEPVYNSPAPLYCE